MINLKLEDLYKLRMPGDVNLSPDGKFVVFTVGRMNRKRNEYLSRIYMWNGKLRAFTSGDKDSMPRITEDGKNIVYYRGKKEGGEIKIIPVDGGESRTIVEVKDGVIDMKIDGKYIYFLSPVKNKEKDDVKRIDRIPFYFNGKGFIYNSKLQIFRVKLKGGKIEKLTDEKRIISSFDVINGKIVYSASDDEREPFMEHLYLWEKGKTKRISRKKAVINDFAISPDEKKIAVFLKFVKRGLGEHTQLYFLPLEGGDYRKVCNEKFSYGKSLNSDARFGGGKTMKWVNNDEIMFIVTERGTQPIMIYSHGKCRKIVGGERSVEAFDYVSGKLAFIAQEMNHPPEVFVKEKKERRVTNFNRRFSSLPKAKKFVFMASDNEKIDGWILLPDKNPPFPAILEIHGGPKTSYGHAFMFEFYYFLSRGFAVIFTNPRGSSGYSEDFTLKIRGAFGDRDYKDLMESMKYVLKNYPIDKKNLFVTGGSYGGFMTNWIVGHTTLFKAAATQRSISNQISFWGTSDIGPWFNNDYIGKEKDLWDAFDSYWKMSPLKYAKNVKTPLLIIHSEQDYRCPVSEAYQLFYALKMQKKEVKMVLFPEENHDLSRSGKPKHREIRLMEISQWFEKHLKKG